MENNQLKDRIDLFILGELSSEESAKFQEEYEIDAALSQEVNLRLKTKGAVYKFGREDQKSTFRDWFEEYEQSNPQPAKIFKGRFTRFALPAAIAAGVAILLAVGYFMFYNPASNLDSQALFSANYERPRAPEALAVPADTQQVDLQALAKSQYFQGKCPEAIQTYTRILNDPQASNKSQVNLYLGICLMENNQVQEAVSAFGHATNHVEQAQWYTALAYLKGGDMTTAKQEFEAIVGVPTHFYREKAVEILEKGAF